MGWRGAMRSINAAAKAAARDADRQYKAEIKQQIAQDAAQDVEDWRNHITRLMSVHTDISEKVDWDRLASAPRPAEPIVEHPLVTIAKRELSNYEPGLVVKLMGREKVTKDRLAAAIVEAEREDKKNNNERYLEYKDELVEWEKDQKLANRLQSGDSEAFVEVIKEFQSQFTDGEIGEQVNFSVEDGKVHAVVQVHTDEIVPNFRRKQLASGKLSETKMPKGEFNEIYQDYVASVAIRIAGDLFQILPLDAAFVTCSVLMLNSATGHMEITPILSVHFVRESFKGLNLNAIDPSDSLRSFSHNMSFAKTKGFSATTSIFDI